MDDDRIAEIAALGGWTHRLDAAITGVDPALATPWPVGEVAAGVGRFRCADGRWIRLHGGFPPLVGWARPTTPLGEGELTW